MLQVSKSTSGTKGKWIIRDHDAKGNEKPGSLLVRCRHTTLHKATDTHWNMETTFDYSNVPGYNGDPRSVPDAILLQATDSLLIRWRTAFKEAEKFDKDATDNQVVDVAKMLKGQRIRFTNLQKATKVVDEMTADEKRALYKRLQEEIQDQEEADALAKLKQEEGEEGTDEPSQE